MRKKKLLLLIGLAGLMLLSCGKRMSKTYIDDQKEFMTAYNNEDYKTALNLADKFVLNVNKNNPQDTFLAVLERGKIALDSANHEVSVADLQKAEQRFLDIEGTISLSEETSSLFLDDTTAEYEAQPLEKIMISPYLALAYWAKGDFQGARVERNRTIVKVNQYIEDKGKETEYLENPFARYLSAIIYENESKFQDAVIEYRKIKSVTPGLASVMDQELNRLKKRPKLNDLVVFVDMGKSPQKAEVSHKGSGKNSKGVGVVVSIVYAQYKARPYAVRSCKVLVNGTETGQTFPLYNLGKTILDQYEKNKGKLIGKLIARAALKTAVQAGGQAMMKSDNTAVKVAGLAAAIFGAASAAVERADLRSWTTLPDQIHMQRSYGLAPGKQVVQLAYLDVNGNEIGRSAEQEVMIPEGQIGVAYFRVVR